MGCSFLWRRGFNNKLASTLHDDGVNIDNLGFLHQSGQDAHINISQQPQDLATASNLGLDFQFHVSRGLQLDILA